jgi:cytochrome c-type biogenesis protein CcmH/NrfG
VTSQAALAETFDGLRVRIEQAYQDRNLAGMEAARTELLRLAAAPQRNPAEPSSAAYFAAYARFRQALAAEADRPVARGYLEDCITELKDVVREQPGHAEARALLGSCNGMSTLYGVMATMTRGLEAKRQMAEARRLAPDNPWVVMQDGLADWATPRLFGGDRELALAKLERATGLFGQAMESGSHIAAWGAAEAWHQLGLRYQELGRESDAQVAFERASAVTSGRVQLASSRS